MEKVSDTHHLVNRKGVWYYRRRVPKALVKAVGKAVIQYSLDTSKKAEAKKRRELEDVKWSAQFEVLLAPQTALPATAPAHPHAISKRQLVELVRQYVDRMDEQFQDRYAADPPESEEQKAEMRVDVEIGIGMLVSADDPRGQERVTGVGERIVAAAGQNGVDVALPYAAFAELVRRALLEIDRRKLARLDDDHQHVFFDQLFNPQSPKQTTFGELADQFLKLRLAEATANNVGKKFIDKVTAFVALVREIIGPDTSLHDVNFDACQNARAIVAQMPSNRVKIYGDLPLDQVIERAAADERPLLSAITQQGYLRTLTDILDLAVKKRLIPSNPAEGLAPLRRDAIAPENKKLPFEPAQLIEFFNCDYYRRCAESGPIPYKHDKTGWRFWLPLIDLFTGARPNEICQLELRDIRQTDKGAWYFDIVVASDDDDEEDRQSRATGAKRLKTATSRRKIPIHPQLIRIGLLQYVEEQREAGATRLFSALKADEAGYFSSYPLKRFRETFLPKAIKLKPRQSFYSFRHTFRDALRAIEAPPDTLLALGAWSQGTLTSDNYGTRSNPDIQKAYIDQIAFPGLDLSHLWIAP
ncbi:site-specific integrase [Methylosinus sp. PW1]|uniref:site-specific integrase n=1 Tax=Methylosinus sp. PW1 TaxID=107636 RepID=UPI00055E60CC|nr:site-specific integrase [Methylosinus sp. PW1]